MPEKLFVMFIVGILGIFVGVVLLICLGSKYTPPPRDEVVRAAILARIPPGSTVVEDLGNDCYVVEIDGIKYMAGYHTSGYTGEGVGSPATFTLNRLDP